MSTPSLLDTSVWARLRDGRLTGPRAELLYSQIADGQIALTEPLLLEMLYSARDGHDFALLAQELMALPLLRLQATGIKRALAAQAQLAALADVSHRVKPIDLLVAAVAEDHATSVIHYDHDYELLAERTDLKFQSVWAAPRASVS